MRTFLRYPFSNENVLFFICSCVFINLYVHFQGVSTIKSFFVILSHCSILNNLYFSWVFDEDWIEQYFLYYLL